MRSHLEREAAQLLQVLGFSDFVREHVFHPTRRWRFDFAWPQLKIAIEIEGGTWTGGAHKTGVGISRDIEKGNEAALLGWLVIRMTNHHVRDGTGAQWVIRAMRERRK